jgi:hypothetical protein
MIVSYVDHGADVNVKLENGNTALHIAALRLGLLYLVGLNHILLCKGIIGLLLHTFKHKGDILPYLVGLKVQ